MTTQTVSFLAACQSFFGLKEGQRPIEFGKEIQALTNDDRKEIASGLVKNGYNIDPSTVEKKSS